MALIELHARRHRSGAPARPPSPSARGLCLSDISPGPELRRHSRPRDVRAPQAFGSTHCCTPYFSNPHVMTETCRGRWALSAAERAMTAGSAGPGVCGHGAQPRSEQRARDADLEAHGARRDGGEAVAVVLAPDQVGIAELRVRAEKEPREVLEPALRLGAPAVHVQRVRPGHRRDVAEAVPGERVAAVGVVAPHLPHAPAVEGARRRGGAG
jgi:hypothetical protein